MKKEEKPWKRLKISRGAYFKALANKRAPEEVKGRPGPCLHPYPSFVAASKAAKKLDCGKKENYRKMRHQDPRLPSRPEVVYADFRAKGGWGKFLGTGRNRRLARECYRTWRAAGRAAKKLGATTSLEYRDVWRKNPKLPSRPTEIYADFPRHAGGRFDWESFFKARPV